LNFLDARISTELQIVLIRCFVQILKFELFFSYSLYSHVGLLLNQDFKEKQAHINTSLYLNPYIVRCNG
jgi:hypothetical protein